MTNVSTALALFLALGGTTWFDALPAGPKRYEAVEKMVDLLMWRAGCEEGEARRAVSRAISEGRKEGINNGSTKQAN